MKQGAEFDTQQEGASREKRGSAAGEQASAAETARASGTSSLMREAPSDLPHDRGREACARHKLLLSGASCDLTHGQAAIWLNSSCDLIHARAAI
jgi:hypothetical protein